MVDDFKSRGGSPWGSPPGGGNGSGRKGPMPPDTCWISSAKSWNKGPDEQCPDGILALYHDQGLIPIKIIAFDYSVNTTLGLPFIRTSPDHGTGFDIAGKGIARATSMFSALQTAWELSKNNCTN